jgi:prepilin-type N-terminal cleavage/methylation domain-containing protein/prepilin-type processing-associated H-X9-DG protein
MSRRKGFTLIELLVVIAIIGILAAMLFPVFARARESARKTQCLANVKNLAMGMQIYLTDYDRFMPREHDANKIAYFADRGCDTTPGCCNYPTLVNPYLRIPVILDEYVKSRDIWRCPSSKLPGGAQNIFSIPDYWTQMTTAEVFCYCGPWFPTGWGGSYTDTVTPVDGCPPSGATPGQGGTFEQDYVQPDAVNGSLGFLELSTSAIPDASKYLVVAERGWNGSYDRVEKIAYPDVCRISWYASLERGCDGDGDAPNLITIDEINKFWGDAGLRAQYARHMGGNNLGFADGHAKWFAADALMSMANDQENASVVPLPPMRVPDWVPGYHG